MNKALNIIAWVLFVISIVAYVADTLSDEAIYFAAAAIFCVIAPRKI